MERKVLGKGLEALISPDKIKEKAEVMVLNPEEIRPNRYQPRTDFKEDNLQELVDSIKEKGVVQPVIVRQDEQGGYELIAGERRLRAVKALGQKEIPAVIKNATDRELLELSIIENIQREDLNPLEEAKAYETLIKNFGFSQEQVGKTVGKNRATIANLLRILSLPDVVKEALAENRISLGHAKAILSLSSSTQQVELLKKIISQGLLVRQAEEYHVPGARRNSIKKKEMRDEHLLSLEEELRGVLGTKVKVFHGKKRGRIQIEYYSLDDLERILDIIRTNK